MADAPWRREQRLDAPPDGAWQLLTSVDGLRQWLADPAHPGAAAGAAFTVPGHRSARIDHLDSDRRTIGLVFDSGRRAQLQIAGRDKGSVLLVDDAGVAGEPADALAAGWSAVLTAARFLVDRAKPYRRGNQAVVVVHGIGNQRPQATLRTFTDALFDHSERYNKPDLLSDNYELRRYQLTSTTDRPSTDLFELYWANRVPGTKLSHTWAWLRTIVLRRPWTVGATLRPLAWSLWATVALAALAVGLLLVAIGMHGVAELWRAGTAFAKAGWFVALMSLLGSVFSAFMITTLGDAARYLDNRPDNIAVRQEIRRAGVDLLRRLHVDGDYQRIVLVGHSLGSVICYDIIRFFWTEVYLSHGNPAIVDQTALRDFERAAMADYRTAEKPELGVKDNGLRKRRTLENLRGMRWDQTRLEDYRENQRRLWCEYRTLGHPWLVSDLVTIGSPLAHADTLLAASPDDLTARAADLELPRCPPYEGPFTFDRRESYLTDCGIRSIRMPTHSAAFAVTRWTNIYAPARGLISGDPVGGAVAPMFGQGVEDIVVRLTPWWRRRTPLAHTSYWKRHRNTGDPATRQLYEALGIDSRRWLDDHVASLPWRAAPPQSASTLR